MHRRDRRYERIVKRSDGGARDVEALADDERRVRTAYDVIVYRLDISRSPRGGYRARLSPRDREPSGLVRFDDERLYGRRDLGDDRVKALDGGYYRRDRRDIGDERIRT